MEQKHRKMLVAYAIFFGVSAVFVAAYCFYFLSGTMRTVMLTVWVVMMAAAWFFLNLTWQRAMARQMDALTRLMERSPEAYLKGLDDLIQGSYVERAYGALRDVNKGVAYCAMKDYAAAKTCFQQVNPRQLRGSYNKGAYYAALALTHFYLEENDAALAIMKKQEMLFSRLEGKNGLGGTLAILRIFTMLANGERNQARKALIEERRRWNSPRFRDDFNYLATKTNQK